MARQLIVSLVGDNSKLTKTLDDSTRKTESFGTKVGNVSRKMAPAVGAAGVAFTALGMKLDTANAKLNTAVSNSDKLSKQDIAGWAKKNERAFQLSGISIAEQNEALTKAINSGADYETTAKMMAAANELAAVKGISFEAAMEKVVNIMDGKGKRTLTEFGLSTLEGAAAVDALEGKLRGTSATLDKTLSGRLAAGKVIVMDYAASVGTTLGPALVGLGGVMQGMPAIIGAMNKAVGILNATLAITALRAAAALGAIGVVIAGLQTIRNTEGGIFAKILGNSSVSRALDRANPFHTGGIAGRDQLAVLQQGEQVIPRGQTGRSGGLTINVSGVGMGRDFGAAIAQVLRDNKLIGVT